MAGDTSYGVPACRPDGRGPTGAPHLVVTDGQVHVWDADRSDRPWPASPITPHRATALSPEALLEAMDAVGVARTLLVPPTWEGPRNDLVLAAAAAHPDRFAALARLDATDPAVVADLATVQATPGVVGVRLSLTQGDWRVTLTRMRSAGFFAEAERLGLPLSIYMPGGYPEFEALAADHPRLRITIDHLGLDRGGRPLEEAIRPVLSLAAAPNLAVKASALPCFVDEPHPFPSIQRAVLLLLEAYGSDRVFWGSDLSRLPCTYGQLVSTFVDHLGPRLAPDDLALLMGGALHRWLGWEDTARQPEVVA